MLSTGESQLQQLQSFIAWWQEAGVDYVTDGEPMNWLSPEIAAPVVGRFVEVPDVQKRMPIQASPTIVADKLLPPHEWPTDLDQLKAMVRDRAALPGLNYGASQIMPVGEVGATAMVIGDFPEEDEIAAGRFGAGPAAKLLGQMLLAAQIVPDLTFTTTLALSRPAAGSLPRTDYSALAAFMNRQIDLVRPKLLILFGSAACEALLGAELMEMRGRLAIINHSDRNTAAVATFHPRTLMAQPQLKAQAWKDLQVVVKKDYL
jgi:uracil-DNA glycosylase